MVALVTAPGGYAFVSALVLMLLIGGVQALGLAGDMGVDLDAHADLDLHADMDGHVDLLGWLGVGRLPLLMLLVLFLGVFGLVGLIGQQASHDLLGSYLPGYFAVPGALALGLPLTGGAARVLARILPHDETTAVSLDTLAGRPARIVTGRARTGSPARARVEDRYGQAHYVMVEPNNPTESFEEGETVLLVRREADRFMAISRGDHYLPQLGA